MSGVEDEKVRIERQHKIRELLPKSKRVTIGDKQYDVVMPDADKKFIKKFLPVLDTMFLLGPCRFRVVFVNEGKFTFTAQMEHMLVRPSEELLPEEKIAQAHVVASDAEIKEVVKLKEETAEAYSIQNAGKLEKLARKICKLFRGYDVVIL